MVFQHQFPDQQLQALTLILQRRHWVFQRHCVRPGPRSCRQAPSRPRPSDLIDDPRRCIDRLRYFANLLG